MRDSIIEELPIDLINNFPLDYLHLVCLGVVKKLMNIWINGAGPYNTKLSASQQNLISEKMLKASETTPCEFARTSRSLKNFAYFKGTEFRTFILYVGPVVLKNILYEEAYKHFILLHTVITICSSDVYENYLPIAKKISIKFVEVFKELYGEEHISYNVHSIIHLVDDVEIHGNLNKFSAFPFETKLGQIKRQVKTGFKPLQQIARRTTEQFENGLAISDNTIEKPKLNKKQLISHEHQNCNGVYLEIQYKDIKLDCTKKNCWFLTNELDIVKMNYATISHGKPVIYGSRLRKKTSFYENPISSTFLFIYVGDNIFDPEELWSVNEIKCKLFCIEIDSKKSAFYPLIHSL